MRARTGFLAGTALAVVVVVVVAVAWQPWVQRSGPVRLLGDDPRVFAYHGDLGSLVQRGKDFPVVYDPDTSCLYLTDANEQRLQVVWPRGSRPVREGTARGVRVDGIGVITDGDTVVDAAVATGDVDDPESWDGVGAALVELDACRANGAAFVVFTEITGVARG